MNACSSCSETSIKYSRLASWHALFKHTRDTSTEALGPIGLFAVQVSCVASTLDILV